MKPFETIGLFNNKTKEKKLCINLELVACFTESELDGFIKVEFQSGRVIYIKESYESFRHTMIVA